jgi:hypothetical protein
MPELMLFLRASEFRLAVLSGAIDHPLTTEPMPDSLIPGLTPHGALRVGRGGSEFSIDDLAAARLDAAFARGGGQRFLQLGLAEAGSRLPPELAFWRGATRRTTTWSQLSSG